MPEYLAPGVYLEETSFRAKSIEGVSTSTTAFVGPTRKGPLSLKPDTPGLLTPEVVTSFGEFERIYGGLGNLSFAAATDANADKTNFMAQAAKAFFDNGGGRLFVARTFNPRTATDNGRAKSGPFIGAAGPAEAQAHFEARMPGSGLNCTVHAKLKTTKAGKATLKSAAPGSLLRLGGDTPAGRAERTGNVPPYLLNDGDKLTLMIGATESTITFSGTRAEVIGGAVPDPAIVAIQPNSALVVTVGGHPAQTIALPNGSLTLAELAAAINAALRFGYARVEGGNKLALGSDDRGSAARIQVAAQADLALGASNSSGSGNVANLDNVTAAEIDNLLKNPLSGAEAEVSSSTGKLVIFTTATGKDAKLSVVTDQAKTTPLLLTSLGLEAGEGQGTAGGTTAYYLYDGTAWNAKEAGAANLNIDSADLSTAFLLTMTLLVGDCDGNEIIYDDLGLSTAHPRWVGEILKQRPSRKSDAVLNPVFLSIGSTLIGSATLPYDLCNAIFGTANVTAFALAGGNDGSEPVAVHPPAADNTVTGAFDDGLQAFEKIEDISILAAPGHSTYAQFETIQGLLISHCENVKYRIAVLDTPPDQTPGQALDVRSKIDSTRAALYYPWVVVTNPLASPSDDRIAKEIALPPSGYITGIYARTDISRGVWKAPANEVVRGALRFETDVTFGQQEVLNPMGVNCLRFFYGRGYRLWGARTASSDPEWKYVNVRRYFIYLERSIDRSTQWAVFEPNGEALWANIRETVSAFLFNEWRSRALLGSKPEEAFFVRCDRSTMTQNDLDNGRLICLIGVAALKPAEFVIFRIGQKTADARS